MKTAVVCLQPPKLHPDTKLMPSFYEYEVLTSHTHKVPLRKKKKKRVTTAEFTIAINAFRNIYLPHCLSKVARSIAILLGQQFT